MGIDPELENRRGLEWLVTARNKCQTLMWRLLSQWENVPPFERQTALAAGFSLWRAVFLLVKEHDQSFGRVDVAAKRFLERGVRTNAISFNDDLRNRAWSSVYYVQSAIHRITTLTGYQFVAFKGSPIPTVREAWNEAFVNAARLGLREEMQRFDGMRCNPVAKPTGIEHPTDRNKETEVAPQVTVN